MEAGTLKTKLTFIQFEAQKRAELSQLVVMTDLSIAEAKLSTIKQMESSERILPGNETHLKSTFVDDCVWILCQNQM